MRLTLCAALFLLAGCIGQPVARDGHLDGRNVAQEQPVSPVLVTARADLKLDNVTSAWFANTDLVASDSWDASAALGLPRPVATLSVAAVCSHPRGYTYDGPGYGLSFDVERPDGRVVQWSYTGSDACGHHQDYTAKELGEGKLTHLEVRSYSPFLAVQYSCTLHVSATLFSTSEVPSNATRA